MDAVNTGVWVSLIGMATIQRRSRLRGPWPLRLSLLRSPIESYSMRPRPEPKKDVNIRSRVSRPCPMPVTICGFHTTTSTKMNRSVTERPTATASELSPPRPAGWACGQLQMPRSNVLERMYVGFSHGDVKPSSSVNPWIKGSTWMHRTILYE